MSTAGVYAGSVHLILYSEGGPEGEGPGHTNNITSSRMPILKDTLPEAHRKSTSTTQPLMSRTLTTHFLRGWSRSTSTKSILQPDCARQVLHLINWLNQHANVMGTVKVKGYTMGWAHPPLININRARNEASRQQRLHQLCTHTLQLDTLPNQIKAPLDELLFRTTSCH